LGLTWWGVLRASRRKPVRFSQDQNRSELLLISEPNFQPPGAIQPPLGVEVTAVSQREEFAQVLAATGFYAIKHGWLLSPGTVVLGVVASHMDDRDRPHLLLLEPFLWDDQLCSRALSTKTVAWVLGEPISTAEANYLNRHGFSALEDLFEESQPDFFDLERPSVV
jgi:Suppressor of fused protein (SUFU)